MADLLAPIETRRANRAISEEKLAAETIERIMTAATLAPSCFNRQPWRFLVVTADDALAKLHTALSEGNYWATHAPALVVVTTKADLDCRHSDGRDYAFFDCGLATQNLILQAVAEGLYAHPMAGFDPLVVKEVFSIPAEYTILTLVALGRPGSGSYLSDKHAKAETSPRQRQPEDAVICYDAWGF